MANQNLSRREFLRLAGLTATAGIVAACAPAGGTLTGASSSADAPGAEAVEITFMGWGGTGSVTQGKTALPDFEDIALNGRKCYLLFDSDINRHN